MITKSAAANVLDTILPRWRAGLPSDAHRRYLDGFVVRLRPQLEELIGDWLRRRKKSDPQSMTVKARTQRNIDAMRIVATRKPEDMTADERRTILGYTGWGGLSIEGVADQFPPDLAPTEFALIHEYYTPVAVAEAIADLICAELPELAGHDGVVRAFEPSVGIGRLVRALGPPRCLVTTPPYRETKWTAVELSEVSARMFAAMRPDVDLFVGSLETWMAEHAARYQSTLSLVVANPPYGQRGEYALQDKAPEYQETAAYAYFMRRCLDLLVPRGLGVFIIPAGFLSGETNRKLREKVLLRHHLEVAFRLPSEGADNKDLFPGARNVVDVLFWRARGGELAVIDPADQFIAEGKYFAEFPSHVLGVEHDKERDKNDPRKKFDRYRVVGDFVRFPPFTPRAVCASCAIRNIPRIEAVPVVSLARDMAEDDESDEIRRALALGRRVDRYLSLVASEDERAVGQWKELVEALNAFRSMPSVAARGGNPWMWVELRALASRRALAASLLRAFQKSGELAPGVATPPDIRPKFAAQPGDVVAQAEFLFRTRRRLSIADLVAFHRSQGGTLTTDAMTALLLSNGWNLDGDDWDQLLPKRAYLNGKLWPKYDRAAARVSDPQAQAQLRSLDAVMNLAVYEDIDGVSPRQGWLPIELVSRWLSEALNKQYGAVELYRFGGTVQPLQSTYERLGEAGGLTTEALWFIGWINHDFALFKPKLSDERVAELKAEEEQATGVTVAEEEEETEETEDDEDAGLGVVRLLLGSHWDRAFAAWVNRDATRRDAVRDAYNRSFRGVIIPKYDGDTLVLSRWTETGPQLKPHQIAGARRILDLLGGLIAFDVGVGKTYTAIAIIAAAREAGAVRRPVVLVPSSLVWKWHDDFLCVLGDYRVLVVGSNRKRISRGKREGLLTSVTDTPEERAAKWSEFQAGLWDVVVLSYDALGRTQMNHEALLEYVSTIEGIQREIKLRQRNANKKKVENLTERDRAILKHGVRAFIEEMLELPKNHKFDPGIAWDDIGIDMLVVDEAASFKNSYKPEAREHGLPKFMGSSGDGSKRAWQLDFRAAAVRRRTGGAGIVLLTATPAKNSPLEFYNLIQLIDPHAFSSKGLMDPEQFIDRFIRISSREIIDMTLKVKMQSVVDSFRNLGDLRLILETYGEFRSAEEVGLKLPSPRSEQVRVPMNADQEEQYGQIVRKLERALRMAGTGLTQNSILGLMARLSVIAMHPKLDGGVDYREALTSVSPSDYASPKLEMCADRVVATAGCGHIIFVEQTAVHLWMREVLVARKIPRERIAILNAEETAPADRLRIARDFNGVVSDPPAPGSCAGPSSRRVPPKYDVIIANSVAYEGVDLQVRTCAIHHLDLPWTPADLEQRNGRAVRQGNELPVVNIFYYLSDRSTDWYRYQLIQGKRGWLAAVLEGQARDTSNPGAQVAMSDEEMLLMVSRDPEQTARAFAERREKLREEARAKVAREAANIAAQAAARFRDARLTTDVERASRLRTEGEERLRDLARVDIASWPWARLMEVARDQDVIVATPYNPPIFEGLRYAKGAGALRTFSEFGRVFGGSIGHRQANTVSWQLLNEGHVRNLYLTPAELEVTDWPDEDLKAALLAHVQASLKSPLSTIVDLEWHGAGDGWLAKWWPTVEKSIRLALSKSSREERYPCVVEGRLRLAAGGDLAGDLIAPTAAGWREFQQLAVTGAELKYGELHKCALTWWQRAFPRGILASRDGEPAVETAAIAPPCATCGTALADLGAHGIGCPRCAEDEMNAMDAATSTSRPEPEAPATRKRATKAAPAAKSNPVPPEVWGERIEAGFNKLPGAHRMRYEGTRGGASGIVLVVHPPDSAAVLAAVDVDRTLNFEIRWMADLRASERRSIEDRLERAVADEVAAEAAGEEDSPPDYAPLRTLLRSLDAELRAGGNETPRPHPNPQDPLHRLALALGELATDRVVSPEMVASWLSDRSQLRIADAIREADPYAKPGDVMSEVWSVADAAENLPLVAIEREAGSHFVDERAFETLGGARQDWLLVREGGDKSRYKLRRVDVKVSTCDGNLCQITTPVKLRAKAEVYLLVDHTADEIEEIHERLEALELTLNTAPKLLADVRHLLLLTGLLIDTSKCQGSEQRAAVKAFEQAKGYYDQAARVLVQGRTAVGAERMHAAMRRIAMAAALIAQSCAAGQVSLAPATLAVSPEDADAVEGAP